MTDPESGLAVSPFRALRFAADGPELAELLCPPYDVIGAELRTRLEQASPHNAVRLVLPRGPASGTDNRYQRAAADLSSWQREGVLVRDGEPAIYAYELSAGEAVTRGVLALVDLRTPEQNVILPHENTMAGPVADRLALTRAVEANLEPIYLVYGGSGLVPSILDGLSAGTPRAGVTLVADPVSDDGVSHRIWRIVDEQTIAAITLDLAPRRAVIADGHHRYATYLQYQAERRTEGAGAGPWDRGLALLVDVSSRGPRVEATHRVIARLDLADAVDAVREIATVREVDAVDPDGLLLALRTAGVTATAFGLTDGSRAFIVTGLSAAAVDAAVPAEHSRAWRELDVTIAHHMLIGDRWGLADLEDVVGFEHDLRTAVHDAAGGTVLVLNPTPVEAVAAVAEAGDRMPRKSTLFTPKPRTGLVMRPFAD